MRSNFSIQLNFKQLSPEGEGVTSPLTIYINVTLSALILPTSRDLSTILKNRIETSNKISQDICQVKFNKGSSYPAQRRPTKRVFTVHRDDDPD